MIQEIRNKYSIKTNKDKDILRAELSALITDAERKGWTVHTGIDEYTDIDKRITKDRAASELFIKHKQIEGNSLPLISFTKENSDGETEGLHLSVIGDVEIKSRDGEVVCRGGYSTGRCLLEKHIDIDIITATDFFDYIEKQGYYFSQTNYFGINLYDDFPNSSGVGEEIMLEDIKKHTAKKTTKYIPGSLGFAIQELREIILNIS